jgi:hypothetical protein
MERIRGDRGFVTSLWTGYKESAVVLRHLDYFGMVPLSERIRTEEVFVATQYQVEFLYPAPIQP